jgi:hypothetical protein
VSIDLGDLFQPCPAFGVFHPDNLVIGPVEIIGNVGYLLIERLEGVA